MSNNPSNSALSTNGKKPAPDAHHIANFQRSLQSLFKKSTAVSQPEKKRVTATTSAQVAQARTATSVASDRAETSLTPTVPRKETEKQTQHKITSNKVHVEKSNNQPTEVSGAQMPAVVTVNKGNTETPNLRISFTDDAVGDTYEQVVEAGDWLNGGSLWALCNNSNVAQQATYRFYQAASERLTEAFSYLQRHPEQGARCFDDLHFRDCPAIDTLALKLGFDETDKRLLLLCLLIQCDANFTAACTALTQQPLPSLSLAGKLFNDGQIVSLSNDSPLRYWQLLHLEEPRNVQHCQVFLDEHCLDFMLGKASLGPALAGLLQPVRPAQRFLESQRLPGMHIFRLISQGRRRSASRPAQIIHCAGGSSLADHTEASEVICYQVVASLKGQLLKFKTHYLPQHREEVYELALQMQRQFLLHQTYYLIEVDEVNHPLLRYFLQQLTQPPAAIGVEAGEPMSLPNFCFLLGALPDKLDSDRYVSINIGLVSDADKTYLWQQTLAKQGWNFKEEEIQQLVCEFSLTARGLAAVVAHLMAKVTADTPSLGSAASGSDKKAQPTFSDLWESCHQQQSCLAAVPEIDASLF